MPPPHPTSPLFPYTTLFRSLRIAERRKNRRYTGECERQHDRRSRIQRSHGAGEDEDAGSDDRADAEEREVERPQGPLQTVVGERFRLQLGDAFPAEQIHANSVREGDDWVAQTDPTFAGAVDLSIERSVRAYKL